MFESRPLHKNRKNITSLLRGRKGKEDSNSCLKGHIVHLAFLY